MQLLNVLCWLITYLCRYIWIPKTICWYTQWGLLSRWPHSSDTERSEQAGYQIEADGNETPNNVATFRTSKLTKSRGQPPTTKSTSEMARTDARKTSRYISGPQDQGISCTRTPQRVNNSESRCAYCVEPHHDTDRCRHHTPSPVLQLLPDWT